MSRPPLRLVTLADGTVCAPEHGARWPSHLSTRPRRGDSAVMLNCVTYRPEWCDASALVLDGGAWTVAPAAERRMVAPRRRGRAVPCRFVVLWRGRWRRLFADQSARPFPHFVTCDGGRVAVDWRTP